MSATVNDMVKIMDSIAPRNLAEEWDNAGFLIGRGSSSVKKIMVALDVSPEVVQQAVGQKADMLITHLIRRFSNRLKTSATAAGKAICC